MISQFVTRLTIKHIAGSLNAKGLANLLRSMDVGATRIRIAEQWPHMLHLVDDELLGLLVIKPPVHLYHLFVKTSSQRSGVGRSLFCAADDLISTELGARISTVNSSLNSVEVYRQFGFAISGPVLDLDGVRFQPMERNVARLINDITV